MAAIDRWNQSNRPSSRVDIVVLPSLTVATQALVKA